MVLDRASWLHSAFNQVTVTSSKEYKPCNYSLFPDTIWRDCKPLFFLLMHLWPLLHADFPPQLRKRDKYPSDISGTLWVFCSCNYNSKGLKGNFYWTKVGICHEKPSAKSESWHITKWFVLKYRNPTDVFQSNKVCSRGNYSNGQVTATHGLHDQEWRVSEIIHHICSTDLAFKS